MPENPTVKDLAPHVTRIVGAQDKLRQAMAKIAAELNPKPKPPAETEQSK